MKQMMMMGLLTSVVSALAGTARIVVQVVDYDTMKPMRNIEVAASFENVPANLKRPKPVIARGITDVDGRCRLSGETDLGNKLGQVEDILVKPPEGYWLGHVKGPVFTRKDAKGVWQPEDLVVTAALQRASFALPQFVKYMHVHPEDRERGAWKWDGADCEVAFDLVEGELMPPYGKGKSVDLLVKFNLEKDNYHFTFEFPGKDNGIVEVKKPPLATCRIAKAPESGYEHCLKLDQTSEDQPHQMKTHFEGRGYAYRIRSRRDADGKLVDGRYGKIYDGFVVLADRQYGMTEIKFLYYLNPGKLNRNLSWNLKDNLCTAKQFYSLEEP